MSRPDINNKILMQTENKINSNIVYCVVVRLEQRL